MDEEQILKRFKTMHFTPEEEDVVERAFPQYIFYHRNGKEIDGYCTGCKAIIELERYKSKVKHGGKWQCPNCSADVTFYAGGKVPASRHKAWRNFVLFRAIDGELYMRAVQVLQTLTRGNFDEWNGITEYDTDYETFDCYAYRCGDGAAVEWKWYYNNFYGGRYKRMKEPREPYFANGYFSSCAREYQAIGTEQIKDTCLKYCGHERYIEVCYDHATNPQLVEFLCLSAKHPQIEMLMKSGFENVVHDKILYGGVWLNWRGNTPQKILRLNTAELKELRGCSGQEYNDYLYFRKNIHVSGSLERKLDFFGKFAMIARQIVIMSKKTGLSHEKVINYIARQTHNNRLQNYTFVRDWNDYIKQCEELGYDITDEGISKPADFPKMHERLSELIKVKADEIAREKFAKRYEERRELEYVGEKYIVIQPQSMDEIIAEGKALCHCVSGYAQRHADGELTIMFLRMKSRPKKPYYTIEVTNDGKIGQCRGYRNNVYKPKPKKIAEFEKEYQKHLDKVMAQRKKRERRKKPILAEKQELRKGA